MPRPSKGTRLELRGKGESAVWIIREGDKRVSTGCRLGDREAAEIRLAEYIGARYTPERGKRDLDRIPVADVIAIYLTDVVSGWPDAGQKRRAAARAERLLGFFGKDMLSAVTGARCRAYRNARGSDGGARRDLQDLSAAIGHHHREGFHRELVSVWLPPAGKPRERWLTRSEIARLVLAAWRAKWQPFGDGPAEPIAKHVARAILFAYYTGSRPGDVLRASFHQGPGRSFIDMEAGLFFRLPPDKRETRKRQPPCRIGDRLASHLRRWWRLGICRSYVVEFDGQPVKSIKTAFYSALDRAGIGGEVVPYTLRHSRATHMLQAGVEIWQVAGALGTSPQMIEAHYGHHDTRNKRAANAR